jgi:hypothetical protein
MLLQKIDDGCILLTLTIGEGKSKSSRKKNSYPPGKQNMPEVVAEILKSVQHQQV